MITNQHSPIETSFEKKSKKIYNCEKCDAKFPNRYNLKRHTIEQHKGQKRRKVSKKVTENHLDKEEGIHESPEDISNFLEISMANTEEEENVDDNQIEENSKSLTELELPKFFVESSEKWEDVILQPDKSVMCAFCRKTFSSKSNGKKHVYKMHKMSTKKSFAKETEMESSEKCSIKIQDGQQSYSESKQESVESDDAVISDDGHSLMDQNSIDIIIDSEIKNKEIISSESESVSSNTKPLDGKTTCPICGKSFKNKTNAKRHYEILHEKKVPSKCLVCGKMWKNKIVRSQHVLNTHKMSKKEYNKKFPDSTFGNNDENDHSGNIKIKKHTTKSHTRSAPALVNVWGNPWGWVTPEGVPKSSKAKNCNYCKKVFNPRDNKQSVSYHLDKCGQFYQYAIDGKKCTFCQKNDFKSYGRLLSHIENEHIIPQNPTKIEIKSKQEEDNDKKEIESPEFYYKENNTL